MVRVLPLVLRYWCSELASKFNTETVRQTAAYGIAMILTSSMLAPYLSVTASPQSNFMDPWWHNSCDIHIAPRQRRHSPPPTENCSLQPRGEHHFQTVKKQIVLLKSTYNTVAPKFQKVPKFEGMFPWLPKISPKIRHKKRVETLPDMHVNFQKYAVAVQYLMKLDVQTEAVHDNEARLKLLRELSGSLKSLLCEIETALNGTCQALPHRISPPARISPSYPERHGLTYTVNLTEMRMRDTEVMTKLHDAIINSEKLAKRLAKKRGENDYYWDVADSSSGDANAGDDNGDDNDGK